MAPAPIRADPAELISVQRAESCFMTRLPLAQKSADGGG
eukprot:CAMPEP_0181493690 /NCGR_PEP_ID=MMETSP1110-20121109/51358_1 /TAXON_ID=174948 /ORGANISM="Symbiodinium sp., Strain CCMP421" /LENGTH=38 /DNA_ID= /DNA_START= /DNA_END= /DNA_ORIENTATION=